jgi:hypothetical protein
MWRKIMRFLFESVYQVVTWVWIAVSISAFFFFASSKSKNGMIDSAVSLFVAILVMLMLIAKKHFWDGDAPTVDFTPTRGVSKSEKDENTPSLKPIVKGPYSHADPRPNTSPPIYSSGGAHPERSSAQPPPIVNSIFDKSRLEWTDYTRDSLYGAMWEWSYRPQFEYMVPRDIHGFCPECLREMTEIGGRTFDENGSYAIFVCRSHPLTQYQVPSVNDAYEGIRRLIEKKLRSGDWKETVWRQLNSPR